MDEQMKKLNEEVEKLLADLEDADMDDFLDYALPVATNPPQPKQ